MLAWDGSQEQGGEPQMWGEPRVLLSWAALRPDVTWIPDTRLPCWQETCGEESIR